MLMFCAGCAWVPNTLVVGALNRELLAGAALLLLLFCCAFMLPKRLFDACCCPAACPPPPKPVELLVALAELPNRLVVAGCC